MKRSPNSTPFIEIVSNDFPNPGTKFQEGLGSFQKRSQLFIGAHDATLSVPIRVNNPDEKDDDGFEVERG